MELTIVIERLSDSRYKASTVELPDLFYTGESEVSVRERMSRLIKAVRSPHIRIQSVSPEEGVVLTLERGQEQSSSSTDDCSRYVVGDGVSELALN
jgi:hypothetical protein